MQDDQGIQDQWYIQVLLLKENLYNMRKFWFELNYKFFQYIFQKNNVGEYVACNE